LRSTVTPSAPKKAPTPAAVELHAEAAAESRAEAADERSEADAVVEGGEAANPHIETAEADDQRDPADLPLDQVLSFRLLMLHKLSERNSGLEFEQALGLSPADGRALSTLGAFEPLSVVELANACSLNKSQASRAAQALVNQGLAHKADSPDDGRGVVLTLTEPGRHLYARTLQLVNQRSRSIFACLNTQEQAAFSAMLDRLIQHNRQRVPVCSGLPGPAAHSGGKLSESADADRFK
jgi:DNA-binding MarR family transcriptional regulator